MFLTSLVRPAKHPARRIGSNLLGGVTQQLLRRRHLMTIHNAKGNLVTIDNLGALVSQEVIISRGGEDESFVMVEREVGLAMKTAIVRQIGVSVISDPEAFPLKFYHGSLHFAHGMYPAGEMSPDQPYLLIRIELLPYPRLIIDKELAGPVSSDVSAATLWSYAPAACEFTLNGTPDRK